MIELVITNENFEKEVMQSEKPVLLDFWAAWCGPCKMLSPTIKEIAEKYEGKIKVGKINVDDEPDLANQYQVMSIPTLLLIKDGKVVNSSVGYRQIEEIEEMLK